MALNIPMPSANFGGQLAQGSQNLFNQLMSKQLREKQLEQAGALLPYQKQEAQLKLEALRRQNDPQAAFDYANKYEKAYNDYLQQHGISTPSSSGMNQPSGMPGSVDEGQTSSPQDMTISQPTSTINVGGREIPLGLAQMMGAFKAPVPGLQEALKNYYDIQKEYGKESAKAKVKRQGERGDVLSGAQSGLQQIARIKQDIENYKKEAKDMGYSTRFGMGAEQATEPDAWSRFIGRMKQRVAHPIETFMHPLDYGQAFGGGQGTKMHEKYLSKLRNELNNLVNVQAKDLNTRFTQNEYDTLRRNKPSISDTEENLMSKLQGAEDAIKSAVIKIQLQQAAAQTGGVPGTEAFVSEENYPSESVGRAVVGNYEPIGSKNFTSGNYEYVKRNGKTYRRKIKD